MNRPRPTRQTLATCLCLTTLLSALGYEHVQLSKLRQALDTTVGKGTLEAVQQRLNDVDERLELADGKRFVTDDDFRAAQKSLSNRIDGAQASATQILDTTQDLSRSLTAMEEQVTVLKAHIETIDVRLEELVKARIRMPGTGSTSKSTAHKPLPAKPIPPPFSIIGVEHRGGERFLSVAPLGSTRLSQINLLQPGDGVAETLWRLKSLDDKSARFDVAGTVQTITIEP